MAKPVTILAWYRKLIAHKFDGSKYRPYPGAPNRTGIALIVQMAKEDSGWEYDRNCGRAGNPGYKTPFTELCFGSLKSGDIQ